jgi:hypothetical protein
MIHSIQLPRYQHTVRYIDVLTTCVKQAVFGGVLLPRCKLAPLCSDSLRDLGRVNVQGNPKECIVKINATTTECAAVTSLKYH